MKLIVIIINFILLVPFIASAATCNQFEVLVKTHKVKQHLRNGVLVSETIRNVHCRIKYSGTEKWISSFVDTPLKEWKNAENFKTWKDS